VFVHFQIPLLVKEGCSARDGVVGTRKLLFFKLFQTVFIFLPDATNDVKE